MGEIIDGLEGIASVAKGVAISAKLSALKAAEEKIANLAKQAKAIIKEIDQFHKQAVALSDGGNRKETKELNEGREALKASLQSFCDLHGYANWLLARFPDSKLADIEGLVKLVNHAELEANDWSLTPGRYVGVAQEEEEKGFNFEQTIVVIHDEIKALNAEAEKIAKKISGNLKEILP